MLCISVIVVRLVNMEQIEQRVNYIEKRVYTTERQQEQGESTNK